MKSLLPDMIWLALLIVSIVFVGYYFVRRCMIWQSWALLAISIFMAHNILAESNPVIRMLGLIFTTLTAMKVVVAAGSSGKTRQNISMMKWIAFVLGWVGMRIEPFLTLGAKALPAAWSKIRFGLSRLIAGFALIWIARQLATSPITGVFLRVIITATLMIGLSLVLHFGLLSINAGAWRMFGAATYNLFRSPLKSKSLHEFWSKRWNLAFSEMTSLAVFRPLKSKAGNQVALVASFFFSGLLHELAISLPVNSGYGLPTTYFLIQGVMVIAEKSLLEGKVGFLRNSVIRRLWLFFWLVIPLPLLFHTQFIKQIIWPLAALKIEKGFRFRCRSHHSCRL